MTDSITIGVSSCLLGEHVRYDGGHKLLMMAHSPEAYRSMGALVAHGKELPLAELFLSTCHHIRHN